MLVSHFQLMVVNNGPIQQKDDFYTESNVLWHTVFAVKGLPLENLSATTSGLSLKTTSFKDSHQMATWSSSSKYKWFPAYLLHIPAFSKHKYRYNLLVTELLALVILEKEKVRFGVRSIIWFLTRKDASAKILHCDITALVQNKLLR